MVVKIEQIQETGLKLDEPIEVRKVPLHNVSDASELAKLIDDGVIEADRVIAVIGKTEGNGGVNDYTRIIADRAFREVIMDKGSRPLEEVRQIPIVWSGGTDGVISPHATIFATVPPERAVPTGEPRSRRPWISTPGMPARRCASRRSAPSSSSRQRARASSRSGPPPHCARPTRASRRSSTCAQKARAGAGRTSCWVSAKAAATPPSSTRSSSMASGVVTLQTASADAKGIEYRIDAAGWTRYTQPVALAAGSTITWRAVDVNGNVEATKTVTA